jgi:RES domain-containing protein
MRVKAWAHLESRTRAILESLVLSREIGDDWVSHKPGPLSRTRKEETILQVPSAVVPQEWNYIVNPASPDLDEIVWSEPAPFNIDPRLLWPALR